MNVFRTRSYCRSAQIAAGMPGRALDAGGSSGCSHARRSHSAASQPPPPAHAGHAASKPCRQAGLSWSRESRAIWEPGCFRCSDFKCGGRGYAPATDSSLCASNKWTWAAKPACRAADRAAARHPGAVRRPPGLHPRPATHWRTRCRAHVADQCRRHSPRDGSHQRSQPHRRRGSTFIFPSSVSAYGPETAGAVKEEPPLRAHTFPMPSTNTKATRWFAIAPKVWAIA